MASLWSVVLCVSLSDKVLDVLAATKSCWLTTMEALKTGHLFEGMSLTIAYLSIFIEGWIAVYELCVWSFMHTRVLVWLGLHATNTPIAYPHKVVRPCSHHYTPLRAATPSLSFKGLNGLYILKTISYLFGTYRFLDWILKDDAVWTLNAAKKQIQLPDCLIHAVIKVACRKIL